MNTLATQLRVAIERWTNHLREHSPLGQLARNGALPPRTLAVYLESLRFLFQHSQLSLVAAAQAAGRLGDRRLAAYLSRKADEEFGHDRWAEGDLARLPAAATQGLRPARAIEHLVQVQRDAIARHPLCMVAYALWAEYFTALLGDEWLEALAACGYRREQVSAIARHLEIDRAHAANGFAEIDRLWHGQPESRELLGVVARAGAAFNLFCEELCRETGALASRGSVLSVSDTPR